MVVTALLFGVGHLNPWQFPPALIWGLIFAWWVILTGYLWPALVAYALYNNSVVTIQHVDVPFFAVSEDKNVVVFNPWWFIAAGVALAALGLWWFHLISNGRQPASPAAVENTDSGNDGV